MSKAAVGIITPSLVPLDVHAMISAFAKGEAESGFPGQVPGSLLEIGQGDTLVEEPVHLLPGFSFNVACVLVSVLASNDHSPGKVGYCISFFVA